MATGPQSAQGGQAPRKTTDQTACDDGWRLALDVIEPAAPRAAVVLGHAMMVDRRTLDYRGDGLASHLARRGLAVVAADLRGHGESGPLASEGGSWSYDDLVEQDTPALIAYACRRFPGLRLTLVGHSLFGHVSLAYVARHPGAEVQALVLLAGNIWLRRFEPSRWRRLEKRAFLLASLPLVRAFGYFPARRLRIGPVDEARDYWAHLVDYARQNDWRARDGFSYADALARVRRPVLGLVGAGDRFYCHPETAQRFLAQVAGARLEIVGRHSGLAFDPDHMDLVTRTGCRPVWDRVADFALGDD